MANQSLVDESLEDFVLFSEGRLARDTGVLEEVDLLRAAKCLDTEFNGRADPFGPVRNQAISKRRTKSIERIPTRGRAQQSKA